MLSHSIRHSLQACVQSSRVSTARCWRAFSSLEGRLPAKRFYPPGATADRGSIEKFARLVRNALREGSLVDLDAKGKFAIQRSLYAIGGCDFVTKFETAWSEQHRLPVDITQRRPHLELVAWKETSEQEHKQHDNHQYIYVNHRSQPVPLARRLALDIGRHGVAVARVSANAVVAASTLLMAIASVPRFGREGKLKCSVYNDQTRKEMKVLCHESSDLTDLDFKAFPPGMLCDVSKLNGFRNAVNDRLQSGRHAVVMECHGKESMRHALLALAKVQKCTAEFEVHWADFTTYDSHSKDQRCLRVRVLRGISWSVFNATRFKESALLKVIASTKEKELAQAIRAELQRKNAVSVHVPAENATAIAVALRALASAPLGPGGRRFVCTPSLGRAKFQPGTDGAKEDDGGVSVVRLYVQQLGKGED